MKLPDRIDIGREDDPFRERKFNDVITMTDEDDRDWPSWRFELEVYRHGKRENIACEEVAAAIGLRYGLSCVFEYMAASHRWRDPN